MITIIAAIGRNYELGKDNKLLWHLPSDFNHFKRLTTGHCIIMGRKTFESLPKLLPNRKHIVITRQTNFTAEGCHIVSSLQEAISVAQTTDENSFVIGGGEIYRQAISVADVLEITRVEADFQADTFFPEINPKCWNLVKNEFHSKDEKHQFDFYFQTYTKK